jgi:4-carboxymuconolactone decarboxylase
VDLVGIVGYYGLVSMTLNVFEVGLPAGQVEPLP